MSQNSAVMRYLGGTSKMQIPLLLSLPEPPLTPQGINTRKMSTLRANSDSLGGSGGVSTLIYGIRHHFFQRLEYFLH